jgi:hypothetical protein
MLATSPHSLQTDSLYATRWLSSVVPRRAHDFGAGPQQCSVSSNDLTEQLTHADSVGYLHAYRGGRETRKRQTTLDIVDFVWRLDPVESRGEINYVLKIPETNGLDLSAKDRRLEISVWQSVDIDLTRNIG